jgi:hypothetical protein
VAYLGAFLAVGLKPVAAAFAQMDPGLDDAARVSGAGFWRRLGAIHAPLAAPAAASGAILVFLTAYNEITVSALLWSTGQRDHRHHHLQLRGWRLYHPCRGDGGGDGGGDRGRHAGDERAGPACAAGHGALAGLTQRHPFGAFARRPGGVSCAQTEDRGWVPSGSGSSGPG